MKLTKDDLFVGMSVKYRNDLWVLKSIRNRFTFIVDTIIDEYVVVRVIDMDARYHNDILDPMHINHFIDQYEESF